VSRGHCETPCTVSIVGWGGTPSWGKWKESVTFLCPLGSSRKIEVNVTRFGWPKDKPASKKSNTGRRALFAARDYGAILAGSLVDRVKKKKVFEFDWKRRSLEKRITSLLRTVQNTSGSSFEKKANVSTVPCTGSVLLSSLCALNSLQNCVKEKGKRNRRWELYFRQFGSWQ